MRALRYVAPLVGVAAAGSIFAAPAAMAASTDSDCTYVSGSLGTECQSPGNVQLNESAPVIFGPQYPSSEGGYAHGYGRGYGGHR